MCGRGGTPPPPAAVVRARCSGAGRRTSGAQLVSPSAEQGRGSWCPWRARRSAASGWYAAEGISITPRPCWRVRPRVLPARPASRYARAPGAPGAPVLSLRAPRRAVSTTPPPCWPVLGRSCGGRSRRPPPPQAPGMPPGAPRPMPGQPWRGPCPDSPCPVSRCPRGGGLRRTATRRQVADRRAGVSGRTALPRAGRSEQQLIRRSAPGTRRPMAQALPRAARDERAAAASSGAAHGVGVVWSCRGACCARMIRESWPQARITSIAPYGTDHASRRPGYAPAPRASGRVAPGGGRSRASGAGRHRLPAVHPRAGTAGGDRAGAGGGVRAWSASGSTRPRCRGRVSRTSWRTRWWWPDCRSTWARSSGRRRSRAVRCRRWPLAAWGGAADAGSYLVMGSDFGKAICVGSGAATWWCRWRRGWAVPRCRQQFVNARGLPTSRALYWLCWAGCGGCGWAGPRSRRAVGPSTSRRSWPRSTRRRSARRRVGGRCCWSR